MNMNFDNFTNVTSSQERDLEMSRVFPSLMRKVYVWMAMALAITGVIAYGAGNSSCPHPTPLYGTRSTTRGRLG